jgi:hypothetical protein
MAETCAFPESAKGEEQLRVTCSRAGGNAAAKLSCGRKNLPRSGINCRPGGSFETKKSPVLLDFS